MQSRGLSGPLARVIALVALLHGIATPAQVLFADGFENPPVTSLNSGVGINLDGVTEFSPEYHFVDAMKQSRDWVTSIRFGAFDTNEEQCLQLDANGWVATLAPNPAIPACADATYNMVLTTIFEGSGPGPAGTYTLTFEGSGTIEYNGPISNLNTSTPGRHTFTYNPGSGLLQIQLTAINPADHLRNIRVWLPGFDENNGPAQLFHPDFLRVLTDAHFRAVRFMDWAVTNGVFFVPNAQQDFADRPKVDDVRYTSARGVPIETMLALANRIDAEPWFNIPHRASDDYVLQYATLVKNSLDAGRRLYVEYSNEVWNGGFPQGGEIEATANASMSGLGDSGFTRRMNQHGLRTAQVCRIFKQVFGSESARVVCVLGAQSANTFTADQALQCPLAVQAGLTATPCVDDIDAVAIAPYFGGYIGDPANEGVVQNWTVDNLFEEITSGRGELVQGFPPSVTPNLSALEIADRDTDAYRTLLDTGYPAIHLLSYEGGQHLVGVQNVQNNGTITNLFVGANRDARMGGAFGNYLGDWKQSGGELFMHFNSTFRFGQFGSWGLLERIDQTPNTPKYNAVKGFIEANPCWWSGCGG